MAGLWVVGAAHEARMPKWRTTQWPNLYPVDETRSADPVERIKRQRRLNAKKRSEEQRRRNGKLAGRVPWLSQQNQTSDRETDEATDLPRPAQPRRRCDHRRAASGDRLAATQCARLSGWRRQEEARPHAPIGEAGRGTPPLSHCERGLDAMAEAGLPQRQSNGWSSWRHRGVAKA